MSGNKKPYLEVLRIFAVLLVIFNHTDGFIYYTTQCSAVTYLYSLILAIICRVAVPLFFMVSGALLLPGEESVGKLLKERVMRILVVLSAVSIIYYAFDIARGRVGQPGPGDFLTRLLSNGIRESFWFLYAYTGILLLLPFFRKIAPCLDGKLVCYLLALKCICNVAIPLIQVVTGITVRFEFGFIDDYFYYLLLGYYIDQGKGLSCSFRKKAVSPSGRLLAGAVLVALNGLLVYYVKRLTGEYQTAALDVFVFLTAPLAFLAVRDRMKNAAGGRWEKAVLELGSCVFGVYLFDNFVRWQFLPVYLFLAEKTAGLIANSVYVLLTFSAGFAYTWILKKVPVIRRYL